MKKNLIIIVGVLFAITIILSTIIYINKENNDKEIKLQEMKQQEEEKKQRNLKNCINTAKNSRSDLWKANCIDPDGNCSISSQKTIDWIESRYQQDLNNCYKLYKN